MDSGNVRSNIKNGFSPLYIKPSYMSQNDNSDFSVNDEINNQDSDNFKLVINDKKFQNKL
jgi:hypothetical protein